MCGCVVVWWSYRCTLFELMQRLDAELTLPNETSVPQAYDKVTAYPQSDLKSWIVIGMSPLTGG